MQAQRRAVRGPAPYVVIVGLSLVPRVAAAGCEQRDMRITFYTCAEGFSHCLTKKGHQPIPFRTVAVGDPGLLGRWLYVEDLGGWVLAADTGAKLRRNSIDVFIGDRRMAAHARRLGVQHWAVRVCAAEPSPPAAAGGGSDPPPAKTVAVAMR